MLNIFISYSSQNRNLVEKLASDFEAMGYTTWYDQELTGGHEWWGAILDHIRRCDLFVFALTQAAVNSLPCQREYEYAHALHKRILPIQLSDIDVRMLPSALQKIQIVDYRQRDLSASQSLTRALNLLPPSSPLPSPLPAEPPVPLSPLAYAVERVNSPMLDGSGQRQLLYDLRDLASDPNTADAARQLWVRLANRKDLVLEIRTELRMSVAAQPPAIPNPTVPLSPPQILDRRRGIFKHAVSVECVTFSPDGKFLVTGTNNHTVRRWRIATGKTVRILQRHKHSIESVAYSPDGKKILIRTVGNVLYLRNVNTGRLQKKWEGVSLAAFSPDGQYLLMVAKDFVPRLWEISGWHERQQFKDSEISLKADAVCYLPNRWHVLMAHYDIVALWDIQTGKPVQKIKLDQGSTVRFAPNGKLFATSGPNQVVSIWQMTDGTRLHSLRMQSDSIEAMAFSPDSRLLLTGSNNYRSGKVILWDVASGQQTHIFDDHTSTINAVAFSPDGRLIASVSDDKTARLWSLDGLI